MDGALLEPQILPNIAQKLSITTLMAAEEAALAVLQVEQEVEDGTVEAEAKHGTVLTDLVAADQDM